MLGKRRPLTASTRVRIPVGHSRKPARSAVFSCLLTVAACQLNRLNTTGTVPRWGQVGVRRHKKVAQWRFSEVRRVRRSFSRARALRLPDAFALQRVSRAFPVLQATGVATHPHVTLGL